MDPYLWLAFVAASSVFLAFPGPTVLLIVSYALSHGRKVAVATALGVASGDLIGLVASLAGLGALLAASANLFTALKMVGAGYLIWLGVRLWRQGPHTTDARTMDKAGAAEQPSHIFSHAFAVTVLNPKSIAFFIAFVPQFMTPSRPFLTQLLVLVPTYVVLSLGNALAIALLADRLRQSIGRPRVLSALNRTGAAILVAMGALTLTLRQNA